MGCASSAPSAPAGTPAGATPVKANSETKGKRRGKATTSDVALAVATPMKLTIASSDPAAAYDDIEHLGAGGFSVVRRVRCKATQKTYAMKIIGVRENDEEPGTKSDEGKERMSIGEVTNEVDILKVLRSESVLRLHEASRFGDKVYVVTELLQGGAVLDAILRMKDERYTEKEAKVVIQRTLLAVDYMHKSFVLHRDLKLENLLLRSNDQLDSVVVADFGLALRCENPTGAPSLPHNSSVDTAPVGTPVYAAPEVVEQKSYGAAIDIWSVGVIAYVLLTGAMPRSLWKSALKYRRVNERDFGFDCYEWDSVSSAGREFVMSCLAFKPGHRLSATHCLNHPWMQKIETVRPAPLRIKSKLRDMAKGMKLPLKRYAPGDVLISQGARASDEVFLIKSGTVGIFVSPVDNDNNVKRDESRKVAQREPGEFIGEMALGEHIIAKTLSSKKQLAPEAINAILAKGPPKRRKNESVSLKQWVTARVYAKKWIGGRRNADVIAETNVECLIMGRREMAWAVAADPEVAAELRRNMSQRRLELSSKE